MVDINWDNMDLAALRRLLARLGIDLKDAANLSAHLADTADAHDASAISNVPAGTIAATDVQTALNELDTEKATTGSVTTVASDLAAHLADTSDAHDASAISILDTAGDFTATEVEGALAELQSDHELDAQNLADHLADTTDAHDASAISYIGGTGISATDVEGALDELADEKANATTVSDLSALIGGVALLSDVFKAMDMATDAHRDVFKESERLERQFTAELAEKAERLHAHNGPNLKFGSFAVPGGTGNSAQSGVGFRPKAVLFITNGANSTTVASFHAGGMDIRGNQWCTGARVASADFSRTSFTDGCILHLQTAGGTFYKASFVSMDADGFTVNFSVVNTGTVYYLAIG